MLTDYERHRLRESARRGRRLAFFTLELPLDSFDTGLKKAMDEVARSGELIGTFPGGGGRVPTRMVFRLLGWFPPETRLDVVASLAGASSTEPLECEGLALQGEPAPPLPTEVPPSIRATGGTVPVPLEKLGQLVNLTG